MDMVRWGMIGAGAVTQKKSGPALYKCEGSQLVGVYSPNYQEAVAYTQKHGHGVPYQQLAELLTNDQIDAVYIATPPEFHKEYALQVLEHGKIPYIEKPIANSFEDAQEIIALGKEKNLPVYVAFYRRGMEKFRKMKEIIDSGALGKIHIVRHFHSMPLEPSDTDPANWRLNPEQAGGGKFVDMMVHVLDVIEYLLGSIHDVSAIVDNLGGYYRVEDTVSATFRCGPSVVGSGLWCYVGDKNLEELLIVGENGRLTTTGLFEGPLHMEIDGKTQTLDYKDPEHVQQPYIQLIVDEILGKGVSTADTQSAANNAKVVDTILQEYRKRYDYDHL